MIYRHKDVLIPDLLQHINIRCCHIYLAINLVSIQSIEILNLIGTTDQQIKTLIHNVA
nr:hypothetical protein Q903MT_gene3450 [Picea sitchensis]